MYNQEIFQFFALNFLEENLEIALEYQYLKAVLAFLLQPSRATLPV